MKANILLLAPYPGLKELALSLVNEYPVANIDVYQGNYRSGPEIIKKLQADRHYDVIITRGGTVATCKEVTTLPIVEIYINAFDIFRILKLAEGYNGKKAFLAYPNLANAFCNLKELLGYSIDTYTYIYHADSVKLLQKLNMENYELILGDHIVYQTAQDLGMNSMLITSGREGVRSAIEEGIRICEVSRVYQEKTANTLLLSKIKRSLADSTPSLCTLAKSSSDRYADIPIINAVTVEDISQLSRQNINIVFPNSLVNQIKDYSQTLLATIITGEDGMGKDAAGYLCCYYGRKKNGVFIRIGCFSLPDSLDYDVLRHFLTDKLEATGGVLFLEDIDKMSLDGQGKLVVILKELSQKQNVKFIASCEFPVELCVQNRKIMRPLRSVLDEVRIDLPPLKYCRTEIGNMIAIYLAQLNLKSGSHIAGIRENGRKMLIEYDWPGNLRQFIRVMNHLSLSKCDVYLSETDVKRVLKKEEMNHIRQKFVPIDLSGTMKDMEKRIIRHVMEEEGMNQTRVEKRLGIGHATLWRKLK